MTRRAGEPLHRVSRGRRPALVGDPFQRTFPQLRQHVSADRLRTLAAAVRVAAASAPTRPHPSAQTAKGNLAVGPALAVIDRVRDAIRKPSER
ncbi:hypothetical protein ACLQ2S_22505 [Micromonospora sp. DT48]|uniref:hypothetical protein n=1 Tax=unclassified Micromonospora TaxID=2617518 RepID=UPI0018AD2146|nr:hypothetical protein [Micromonospora sp. CP22]